MITRFFLRKNRTGSLEVQFSKLAPRHGYDFGGFGQIGTRVPDGVDAFASSGFSLGKIDSLGFAAKCQPTDLDFTPRIRLPERRLNRAMRRMKFKPF